MISFWTGMLLLILVAILMIVTGSLIAKKKGRGSLGGLIGFFVGVAFVLVMMIVAGRLYVVTGDGEFSEYLVYGSPKFLTDGGDEFDVAISGGECMVINDWNVPVIVEKVVYGGYGFGGDTYWIEPKESETFDEPKIFYFYEDDSPPDEISIRGGDDDEYVRLWLRNKRD